MVCSKGVFSRFADLSKPQALLESRRIGHIIGTAAGDPCKGRSVRLVLRSAMADITRMDLTTGIAQASTDLAGAKLRMEVSTRVMKLAQAQGQVAADLVSAAVESVQASMEDIAGDLGGSLDAYA
jgi:hypothetical protein